MNPRDLVQDTLRKLAALGVREVCVAAGARNAPLVAALAESRSVRLWHFFEERCAAFFALGRIGVTRRPVAVVTTSGTAAAELLPACIEAYYQAQRLVLVTADRPERFRGSGAPQAIEQVGLFGSYARTSDDADHAEWSDMPLHLNVCLDEPLTCEAAGIDFESSKDYEERKDAEATVTSVDASLVLAAGLTASDAAHIAPVLAASGLPIVAEATANLHLFPELHEQLVFGGERALQQLDARRVLRIGAVPSWRWWRDLENRPEVQVTNLSRAFFPGLARRENVTTLRWGTDIRCTALGAPTRPEIPLLVPSPGSELDWMLHLQRAIPARSRVFLGNSLPIREWNMLHRIPAAADTHFFANRGANGIDGLISTFLGIAADHVDESWMIVGDLSALYDLAAPWILAQLPANRRIRIVIIHNGGGKIFSRVASLRDLPDRARQIIENRHETSFEPFAQLWGIHYRRAEKADDLHTLPDAPVVIEIRPEAET
ncbi:MAG: hypothetical protein IPK32_06075 [Verrucomicrobiaceae bacterium]|nr:hypothetical protein [Verrucomicrobiaceae bacterium]